jgi:DNA recombination protein RmuC
MDAMTLGLVALALVAGLALAFGWFARRGAAQGAARAAESARAQAQQEIQRLGLERDEAQRRATELAAERSERDARLEERGRELSREIERRSAAEASLARMEELKGENAKLAEDLKAALARNAELGSTLAELRTTLEEERKATQEKLALLENAKTALADAFKALSSDALNRNNDAFLQLAKQALEKYQETAKGDLEKRNQAIGELVKPIRESLDKVDVKIRDLEKARIEAYQEIKGQIRTLTETEKELRAETGNLVKALRAPQVRGRWGEMQLRRVVEIAGMVNYCDFNEQPTVESDGGRQRPDMLVHLPAGRQIVVDSKVPMDAFLEAVHATDEKRRLHYLQEHARQLRDHVKQLTAKAYWEKFEQTPEFVVLFLPGESFFSAALEQDPSLLEEGGRHVILATPTTLIGLLRAVAYGWREDALAANAREISQLGIQLYDRISTFGQHLNNLGNRLRSSVETYNDAVGSLERSVLPGARRFRDLGAASSDKEIKELSAVDSVPRRVQAEELLSLPAPEDETGADAPSQDEA